MKQKNRNEKTKTTTKKFRHIPFRYIAAMVITVLELLGVIGIVVALCYFVPYFYLAAWLTEIACIIRIIASDDNPDYKVPWLLVVMVLPIAGFMLYFMFYSRTLQRKYIRRLKELKEQAPPRDSRPLLEELREKDLTAYGQANMLCNIAETGLYTNTRQTYFPAGERMHPRMLEDLRSAERFIFMEYFIIEEGKFWNSILEILREKAARGVEVRLVYDDIGCMTTLPGNYAAALRACGIRATPFSRLRGNADSEFNNRSHRKILVVDGRVGYTGGINLADEYINEVERFGHWKDTGLRLEGEAVRELTRLFLIDYGINVKDRAEAGDDYFPVQPPRQSEGYLIPFGDGPRPIYQSRVGKSVIQNMLAGARRYVYLTSPYLIIDNDLCQSIENTAMRGVCVKIILPHIPDKKLVFEMTRSFYPRLMKAGVELYEYEPGFIHAKSYLCDDEIAMIGTINLDYRSLVHHFENGVWLYRCESIPALREDMEETLKKCVRVTPETTRIGVVKRLFRSVARIFAPLM